MFTPLPSQFSFPEAEKRVLAFWDEHSIFEESLRRRAGQPRFVFYEGPPTANGMPHPGHCLTRAMKDIFPRYRTMCGFLVERKAGWDTHGLPVEREVCKELGIRTKQEIEAFGVEKFNLKCIQSVFRYTREWEEMTRRLGFWVNLRDAYVTFHQSYVESVWWSLKTLFERGVLYQGHKVVWWWAQGGTALSSGEVGEGYKKVDDPSVFVKFPITESYLTKRPIVPSQLGTLTVEEQLDRTWTCLQEPEATAKLLETKEKFENRDAHINYVVALRLLASIPPVLVDEECDALKTLLRLREFDRETVEKLALPRSLLVWTTTPWTLVSNHFAAVSPDIEYALVHDAQLNENLYVAAALVDSIARKIKRELTVLLKCKGADIMGGSSYLPPYAEVYYDQRAQFGPSAGWQIVSADFVTTDSGTGIVHIAPAFGEADFSLLQKQREEFGDRAALPVLCAVNPDGTFNADAPERYRGRWVKECDKEIIRELRDERKTPWGTPLLLHQEVYNHDYPFCPQAPDDPLIQYARKSWFVRTSAFKAEFLKNNAAINWLPEHIKEGRFGNFLRENVDWALSRERYWGTPLPIWQCEACGRMEAIGSFAELQGKPGATDHGYWDRKVAEHRGEEFPDHLRVHKPYIDEWTYECAACAGAEAATKAAGHGRMRRVPEVIDCWWDAGSMPFAQWGFPHAPGSIERFSQRFPADFISEAQDQTRGWFYGLLAISTLLFSEAAMEDSLAAAMPGAIRRRADARLKAGGVGAETHRRLLEVAERLEHKTGSGPEFSAESAILDDVAMEYPLPYRTCICLGLIAGEDGEKMSKKLRNYREPTYIFDTFGADAMRWYFFSAQAPWTSVRFQEAAIRDSQREFLVKLYNVLSFFTIYASIDGFDPSQVGMLHFAAAGDPGTPSADAERGTPMGWRPTAQRSELDRWIVTELRRTVVTVRGSMDRFENFPAAQALNEFVEALSNWYVRRSRDRFWRGLQRKPEEGLRSGWSASDQDKWDAYHTLYGCLRSLSILIAPFTPFFAETMWQTLRVPDDPPSVHLSDYVKPEDIRYHDDALSIEMNMVREIASLGRAARSAATVKEAKKVRQPLARVEIVLARHEHEEWLRRHADLIAEELNVKSVEFTAEADEYVTYRVVPNFKAIGEKYRALVPKIKAALGGLSDTAGARRQLLADGVLPLPIDGSTVELTPSEVEIRLDARPGWAAAQGRVGVVVLSTELTPELLAEGQVREFMHHVQAARKELDLAYEARIDLHLEGPAAFQAIVERFAESVRSECLVNRIVFGAAGESAQEIEVEGQAVKMAVVVQTIET